MAKTIEEKAKAYDEVRKKIAIRFGSNVADEIFSQFEENEDERIRKSLSTYFAKFKPNDMWDADFSFGDIVAWLEKQGETKSEVKYVYTGFRVGDVIVEIKPNGYCPPVRVKYIGEGAYSCESDDGKRFLSFPITNQDEYKLVEQKPEWSEEDETNYNRLLHFLNGGGLIGGRIEELVSWLKSLKDRVQPQTRNEWNEDDEAFLEDIICKVESDLTLNKDEKNWLKSLRSKPKQKLSEEDEKMVERCLQLICESDYNLSDKVDLEFWLKSLRPQSQWKPSDEQMYNLSRACNGGTYRTSLLLELYQDLNKLK